MASWAKAYVDLRHHPDLFGRPDCDFRLWVCLILHAKEHCPDGVIRGLSVADLRGMFGIKAPAKSVAAALAHFAAIGWTSAVDGGFVIVKFVKRQLAAGDTPEAHAARQRRYRQNHGDGTNSKPVTSRSSKPVTSLSSHGDDPKSDADSDTDSDTDQKQEIRPDLLDGWEPGLLARVKDAVESTRKSGTMSVGVWRAFLLSAKGFTPAIRARAAETYLDRACASTGKDEKYLIGIMSGEHGRQAALPLRKPAVSSLAFSEETKASFAIAGRKEI